MKTFEDLEFSYDELGEHAHMLFDNDYGVSVVRGRYTYGGAEGLYELAVIHMPKGAKVSRLCYDTPVTNDVMGHLEPQDITDVMKQVAELPAIPSTDDK
jgi:hypothetical protein